MSEHRATLQWQRKTPDFTYESYDRTHQISFPGGASFQASSAVEYRGDARLPNPEQLLAASASSCHMLSFLAIAAKYRFVVDAYEDESGALLEKNAAGKMAVTRITLRPKVRFGGDKLPSPEQVQEFHHKAHEMCFIANSLASEVVVEPRG